MIIINVSKVSYAMHIRSIKYKIDKINEKVKLLPNLIEELTMPYEEWSKREIKKSIKNK